MVAVRLLCNFMLPACDESYQAPALAYPAPDIADLDQGASLFDDHIGSWIAAGWAYFVSGDLDASRARFERAHDIDHKFAESFGSLAVLDAVEGNTKEAQRKALTAVRLDRECFSATLAQTLLLSGAGNEHRAKELFEQALTTPIGKDARDLAHNWWTLSNGSFVSLGGVG